MANFYDKTTSGAAVGVNPDRSLILRTNETLYYPFNVGLWSRIRLGMYGSFVANSGDNNDITSGSDVFAHAGIADQYWFGIVGANSLPSVGAQASFAGMFPNTSTAFATTGGANRLGNATSATSPQIGSIIPNGTKDGSNVSGTAISMQVTSAPSAEENYFFLLGIEFEINNRGTGSQTITVKNVVERTDDADLQGDTSFDSLLIDTNRALSNPTDTYTAGFTQSGLAVKVPDAILIHNPFSLIRYRVHSLAVFRVE